MENQVVSVSSSSDSSSTKLVVAAKDKGKLKKVMDQEAEMGNPKPGFQILSGDKIENPGFGLGHEDQKEGGSSSRSRVYTCNFCRKEFSTSQALGGHQNAHKQEREWEKKRKQIESEYPTLAFLNPYLNRSPFSSGGSWLNSLSYDNHLGARFDAFFQKPSFYSPTNSIGYSSGHGGLAMNNPCAPPLNNNRLFAGKNLVQNDGFSRNSVPNTGFSKSPISNDPLPKNFVLRSNVNDGFPNIPVTNDVVSSKNLIIGDGYSRNLISTIGKNSSTDKDLVDKEDTQQENGSAKDWGQDLSLKL